MKKTIGLFVLTLLLFGMKNGTAQISINEKIDIGVKAGISASYFRLSSDEKEDLKIEGFSILPLISFHIGIVSDYEINDQFSIQPTLRYVVKGQRENFSSDWLIDKNRKSFSYLELPINAVYKTEFKGKKIYFGAGPYLGYALTAKNKYVYKLWDKDGNLWVDSAETEKYDFGSNKDFKRFDYGVNALVGAFINEQLGVDLSYGLGLSNISSSSFSDERKQNRVVSLSVSYWFN